MVAVFTRGMCSELVHRSRAAPHLLAGAASCLAPTFADAEHSGCSSCWSMAVEPGKEGLPQETVVLSETPDCRDCQAGVTGGDTL